MPFFKNAFFSPLKHRVGCLKIVIVDDVKNFCFTYIFQLNLLSAGKQTANKSCCFI